MKYITSYLCDSCLPLSNNWLLRVFFKTWSKWIGAGRKCDFDTEFKKAKEIFEFYALKLNKYMCNILKYPLILQFWIFMWKLKLIKKKHESDVLFKTN